MAKKCNSILKSIGWCQGKPQLPGIRRKGYCVSKQDVVAFPQYERDENGRITSTILKGDIVLAADAKVKYVEFDPSRSQHTSDPQGEAPSQTQLNKLVLVCPGVDEDTSAASAFFNNNDLLWLFQDMDGRYRLLGNEKWPTKTTVGQDNGQGPTGQTATTINVEVTDEIVSPFYVGKLDTDEGEIDCSGAAKE